jgi:hypothetical protein
MMNINIVLYLIWLYFLIMSIYYGWESSLAENFHKSLHLRPLTMIDVKTYVKMRPLTMIDVKSYVKIVYPFVKSQSLIIT